jgi:hypothetical protein
MKKITLKSGKSRFFLGDIAFKRPDANILSPILSYLISKQVAPDIGLNHFGCDASCHRNSNSALRSQG